MQKPVKIAGGDDCSNSVTCPGAWDNGDPEYVYVQGTTVDAGDLGLDGMPAHESLVRIPRRMWEERT